MEKVELGNIGYAYGGCWVEVEQIVMWDRPEHSDDVTPNSHIYGIESKLLSRSITDETHKSLFPTGWNFLITFINNWQEKV